MTAQDLIATKKELSSYIERLDIKAAQKARIRKSMDSKLNVWILAFGGEINLDDL